MQKELYSMVCLWTIRSGKVIDTPVINSEKAYLTEWEGFCKEKISKLRRMGKVEVSPFRRQGGNFQVNNSCL